MRTDDGMRNETATVFDQPKEFSPEADNQGESRRHVFDAAEDGPLTLLMWVRPLHG